MGLRLGAAAAAAVACGAAVVGSTAALPHVTACEEVETTEPDDDLSFGLLTEEVKRAVCGGGWWVVGYVGRQR